MNLLSVLLKVLLTDTAISALSGKTGLSTSSLKKLLPLAIPLLLRYMTNNASSQSGAASLLGALTQHRSARSAEEMLANADTEDGSKIVKHILGDDETRAVETLAAEADMSSGDVTRALSGLAPVLLTVLASAMLSANNQSSASQQNSGLDLSDLLGVFGGSSAASSSGSSLLGSLLGSGSASTSSSGGSLLNALLGGGSTIAQQPAQQQSVSGSLLSSLFGGSSASSAQQSSVQPLTSSSAQSLNSGSSLMNALLGVSSAAAASSASSQQVVQQSANNVNGNSLMSLLLGALK